MQLPSSLYWHRAWAAACAEVLTLTQTLTKLTSERDNYKDAVDKAHAELDKSNDILRRVDSHRSLPERIEVLRERVDTFRDSRQELSNVVQKCHALISASPGCEEKVATARLDDRVAALVKQNENQAKLIRENLPYTPSDSCYAALSRDYAELRERHKQSCELHDKIVAGQKETIDELRIRLECANQAVNHSAVLVNELTRDLQRLRACTGLGLGDVLAVCQKLEAHGFKPADANWVTEVSSALDALSNWKVAGKNLKERAETAESTLTKSQTALVETRSELLRVREANGVLVEAQKTCDPVLQRTQAEVIARQQNDVTYLKNELACAHRLNAEIIAAGFRS